MPVKMGKRLVAVCSVAVATIYSAGYIYTLPSVQAQSSAVPPLSPTNNNTTPGAAAAAHSASASANSGQGASPSASSASGSSSGKHGTSSSTSAKSGHSSSGASANHSSANGASTPSGKSSSKPASATAVKYKDGTYTGVGTNPYGSIALSVVIKHGKIVSVPITQWTMHYPQYVIDPQLPKEVISMQTWRIYIVSGATASTYNFAQAVYQALQKAKA